MSMGISTTWGAGNPNRSHPSYTSIRHLAALRNPGRDVQMSLIENVDPAVLDSYQGHQRIMVRRVYPDGTVWERTGRIGVSLGWTPVLLLVHRSNSHGSWDTLDADDRVVAIWDGRKYHRFDADSGPYSARTPYVLSINAKRNQLQGAHA